MKLLFLGKGIHNKYRSIKGNENASFLDTIKKLTRNVALATKLPPRNEEEIEKGNELYAYGNLWVVVRNDKVIWIHNWKKHAPMEYEWELDKERYVELNELLGIEDDRNIKAQVS